MAGNPFEGWRQPLPWRLAARGFTPRFASVAEGVTLSYVRRPDRGRPLVLIPAQMATWQAYARVAAGPLRARPVIRPETRAGAIT